MADRCREIKRTCFEVEEDKAGELQEEMPETYSYLPGDLPGDPGPLSGHMDTVEPSKGKKGIIGEDGVSVPQEKQFLELMMWQDLWRFWKESAV